jgi:hypothetical protein
MPPELLEPLLQLVQRSRALRFRHDCSRCATSRSRLDGRNGSLRKCLMVSSIVEREARIHPQGNRPGLEDLSPAGENVVQCFLEMHR